MVIALLYKFKKKVLDHAQMSHYFTFSLAVVSLVVSVKYMVFNSTSLHLFLLFLGDQQNSIEKKS